MSPFPTWGQSSGDWAEYLHPCFSGSSRKTLLDPEKENCTNITLITERVTQRILENGSRNSASTFPSPSLMITCLISQPKEVKLVFGFFFFSGSLLLSKLVSLVSCRIYVQDPSSPAQVSHIQSNNNNFQCLKTAGQLYDTDLVPQNSCEIQCPRPSLSKQLIILTAAYPRKPSFNA